MIDTAPTKSRPAFPPGLWRHLRELAALQWRLLEVDFRSTVAGIRLPTALLTLSATTLVAAEVVLLIGIATYAAEWTLRPSVTLIAVGMVAALLALGGALFALRRVASSLQSLERSRNEMALSLQMVVTALSRHDDGQQDIEPF
jgi:hypothetical protein